MYKMEISELNEYVDRLKYIIEGYRKLSKDITEDKSLAFKIDTITLSIADRAISILEGFKMLYLNNNIYCAQHLVRIQLDNLIRLNSICVANNKHEFIDYILQGKPINFYKDNNGLKFTDSYLAKSLNASFPDAYDLYNKYCGIIHFGEKHLNKIKTYPEDENIIYRIEVGALDNFNLEEKLEIVKDMTIISLELIKAVESYSIEKKTFNYDI